MEDYIDFAKENYKEDKTKLFKKLKFLRTIRSNKAPIILDAIKYLHKY